MIFLFTEATILADFFSSNRTKALNSIFLVDDYETRKILNYEYK